MLVGGDETINQVCLNARKFVLTLKILTTIPVYVCDESLAVVVVGLYELLCSLCSLRKFS